MTNPKTPPPPPPPQPELRGEDDTHMRHQVVEPGLSADDDRLHTQALEQVMRLVKEGKPWDKVVAGLRLDDAELKAIVLDDFLKIALADRHFNKKQGLKEISKELRIPMDTLLATKQSMIDEVRDASLKVYQLNKEAQQKTSH